MEFRTVRGGAIAAAFAAVLLSTTAPAHAQNAAASNFELATKGTWDAGTTYAKDDIVVARGSAWISLKANNKNRVPGQTQPSSATFWQLFARGFNPTGAWSNVTKYQPDDLATFGGQTWRAKITQTNRQPAANQFWELFAAKGAAGPNTGIDIGTQTAPSISFNGDPTTGIYSPVAGKIAMVAGGSLFLHDRGTGNVALGLDALKNESIGDDNTAIGSSAMKFNSVGVQNTAVGSQALLNTTGSLNTGVGYRALETNTSGADNTAIGASTLLSNSSGTGNVAIGKDALKFSASASYNTAVGTTALLDNTLGTGNTAIGYSAMATNTEGNNNVALGNAAMPSNIDGSLSTAVGAQALQNNNASNNTALGANALFNITTGVNNIAIGASAGFNPNVGNSNIFIGNSGIGADDAVIRIGVHSLQTKTFISGIAGATAANQAAVLIDTTTGQLGTVASSRRYKEDIAPMGDMTAMLMKLKPVTFHYKRDKDDGTRSLQYGLIAEEVAETMPYLAVFNADGTPETVKYHLLPSFLLAGYQAQQTTIEAQADEIARLKGRVAANEALEERLARLEAAMSKTKAASLRQ